MVPLWFSSVGLYEFEGYGGSFEMCGASNPLKGLRSAVVEGYKVLARWRESSAGYCTSAIAMVPL